MPATYQLYKICKIIFKLFDRGKCVSLFGWWHGGRGIMKKLNNGGRAGEGGLKFCDDVILNGP